MNLLEIYLIISTIALAVITAVWSTSGYVNQFCKAGFLLLTILGGFLTLHAIGFAIGLE